MPGPHAQPAHVQSSIRFYRGACQQRRRCIRAVVGRPQLNIAPQHKVRQSALHYRAIAIAGARHGRRAEETVSRAAQRSLRNRRSSAARPCAGEDARLGDPQGASRSARAGDAVRSGAHLADRRRRGARLRHGWRRQLQRRVGRARPADLAARRAQESVPRRRLRCVRHRLGRRLESAALERRRRSHRPLQSGRRRR